MQKPIVEEAVEMLRNQGIDQDMVGYSDVLAATITAVTADRTAWVQRDGFVQVAKAITGITVSTRH